MRPPWTVPRVLKGRSSAFLPVAVDDLPRRNRFTCPSIIVFTVGGVPSRGDDPMVPVELLQIDLGVSTIPHIVFDAIHLVLLLIVGYFAIQAFGSDASKLGTGFSLFVLAEISYIGYHVGISTFLLSHTISEVLVLLAFVLVFLGVREGERIASGAAEAAGAPPG